MSCSATLQLLDSHHAECVQAAAQVECGPEYAKGMTLMADHLHWYNYGGVDGGKIVLANQDSRYPAAPPPSGLLSNASQQSYNQERALLLLTQV